MSKHSKTAAPQESFLDSMIPPIEIGSFVALQPDQSKFIGSASGAFFANTVFRAFANIHCSPDVPAQQDCETTGTTDQAPDTAHNYLAATETGTEDAVDDALGDLAMIQEEIAPSGTFSYGISCPKLGLPPSPAVAKKLLMTYFRKWHPFFPFLHGPTFFEQVNRFYGSGSREGDHSALLTQSQKLSQAMTFQAVFNIADSIHGQKELEPQSRIQSSTAVTNLLGVVSLSNDISSLQAILAVELYLITVMSLRAASTVHGVLTRMMYQSGLHRCPSRYVQLPPHICEIRQRIFWTTYVLDRYLSQALGHPVAISDDEVDVCIPGMVELHNPVRPREPEVLSSSLTAEHETSAHMPQNSARRPSQFTDTGPMPFMRGSSSARLTAIDAEAPTLHHTRSREGAGENVLGHLITYSQLVGSALDLFHKSIHSRFVTWEKVMQITYRTHSWWNNLPASLQEGSNVEGAERHGDFFAIQYHYLILFINRPFLSLPTYRTDFQSSIQAALGAARSIIQTLKSAHPDSIVLAWPGTLTATWMSGLVVSFASLLGLYPVEKARCDLNHCISVLSSMNPTWNSSRQCQAGLNSLLDKLSFIAAPQTMNASLNTNHGVDREAPVDSLLNHTETTEVSKDQFRKRRKHMDVAPPTSDLPTATDFQWQPILEYLGPDFGFDANQTHATSDLLGLNSQNPNSDSTGLLFEDMGWDSYVRNLETHLNF